MLGRSKIQTNPIRVHYTAGNLSKDGFWDTNITSLRCHVMPYVQPALTKNSGYSTSATGHDD